MKLIILIGVFLLFWTSCSDGTRIWNGESSITAVRGESATMTWSVSLTDADANLLWTYVKIINADGDTLSDLMIFQKSGQKTIRNPSYQSRASDLTSNITQTGSVVTIMFTMANLRTTDEMKYRAVLGFQFDSTIYPGVTLLVVQVRVHNFEGPENVTVNELEEFNVRCSADGKPPPTLTIVLPNGDMINGTKTLNHTITAYRNMTGMYNCTAENEVTAPQTKSAWINVWYQPEIPTTFNANPVKVCKNKTVNLTCANSIANPPVNNYTLHDVSGFLDSSKSGYFEQYATTLGVNTVWCLPLNKVGRGKKASTHFTVVGPPNVTLHKNNNVRLPVPVVVVEGGDINVTFSYSGQLNVTWEKLSGSQTSGQSYKDNLTYGLGLSPVNRNHSGVYRVTARDANGCETNRTFNLSVQYLPEMPEFNANPTTVCKNKTVSLTCANSIGNPRVNNFTLHDASGFLEVSESGYFEQYATTLGVNIVYCFPWNDVGKGKKASTDFTVVGPPNVTLYKNNNVRLPEPVVLVEGGDINVTFSYSGQLNVTWEKLSGSQTSGQSYKGNLTYGLGFSPVNRSHSGTYRVTARDANGCETKRTFNLSVQYSPENRTTCYHKPDKILEKSDVTLTCESMSFPKANVSWDQKKNNGEAFKVYAQDNGKEFVCTACNALGCGFCKTKFDVMYGPKGRLNCSRDIQVKEGDDVSWFCKASSANPPPIYSVSHRNKAISNMSSGLLTSITKESNGSFITCNVSNKINSDTCSILLMVTYLSLKCNETKILKPSGPAVFNLDGDANPEPRVLVSSAKGKRINGTDCDPPKWKCLKIPKSYSAPYSLVVQNGAGNRSHKLSISSQSKETIIKAHLKIKNKEMKDRPEVKPVMEALLTESYRCNPNITKYEIKGFKAGSLFMDFQLTAIEYMDDYLLPLSTTIRGKSSNFNGQEIGEIKPGSYKKPDDEDDLLLIIIITIIVVFLPLVLIFLIWYCKRKRSHEKKPALVDNGASEEMHMHDNPGASI